MSRLVLALLLATLIGCARASLPEPSSADVASAAARWPGATAGELRDGRALYQARCSSCHRPVAPSAIAVADWPGHVAEMRERAGLDAQQARSIERYLITIASRTTH